MTEYRAICGRCGPVGYYRTSYDAAHSDGRQHEEANEGVVHSCEVEVKASN
jgi:hypothetical protein